MRLKSTSRIHTADDGEEDGEAGDFFFDVDEVTFAGCWGCPSVASSSHAPLCHLFQIKTNGYMPEIEDGMAALNGADEGDEGDEGDADEDAAMSDPRPEGS